MPIAYTRKNTLLLGLLCLVSLTTFKHCFNPATAGITKSHRPGCFNDRHWFLTVLEVGGPWASCGGCILFPHGWEDFLMPRPLLTRASTPSQASWSHLNLITSQSPTSQNHHVRSYRCSIWTGEKWQAFRP
jgi:hypothetical protein